MTPFAFSSQFQSVAPSPYHGAEQSLTDKVQRIKVGMLYDQLPQGLIATTINSALLAWIMSSVVHPSLTAIWFGLVAAVSILRFGLVKNFRKEDREGFDHRLWRRRFMAGALAAAALWGSAGVVLFPASSYEHQAFIGFVLAGMTAGATGSMASDDKIFRLYMMAAIVPYTLRLLIAAHSINIAMAIMCVAFIAALTLSARKNTRNTSAGLRLRFENQDLIAKLKTKAGELSSVNAALTHENAERQKTEAELLKANEEAKAATKAKSQFLANMSHEIRTPMNGVFGMTDLLMRTELDERQRKLVKTINESAKSLLTIINDILDLSRIEAGKLELDIHEFNLRDAIERAADLFAGQADNRGLDFSVFIDRSVPVHVKGDSGRLKQILLNLAGNALKFTKYGEVSIAVTRVGGNETSSRVRIEVRDTGIGIDPALQQQLFQPFAQAETSISRRFGGTGLGLSISHLLVDLMGGAMELKSELGKGTRVAFEIPLEHGSAGGTLTDSDLTVLEGARILVVDDRETNRDIMRNYLEGAGAAVQLAASGTEAWPLLVCAAQSDKPFHAAIIDMMMPVENGLELSQRIKKDPSVMGVKVILATSMNWQGDIAAIREAGIEAVLTKPIRSHDLVDQAARAIAGIRHPGWRISNSKRRQEPSEKPRPNFKARLLLAEDNPVNVEVAKEFLSCFGCTVHVAANGLEAVAFASSGTYDIILMDCQMPVMDGLTAARRIRGAEIEKSRPRTPIIAVTANAFAEDRIHCVEAGMDDYLCKPYSETQLEQILSKWLAKSAAAAEVQPVADSGVPAAAEAPKTEAIIDMGVIRTLRDKRPDLLMRLVKTYLSYAPTALAELDVAVREHDFASIGRLAHSLKSSSANLGATALSSACRQLEVAAKDKNDAITTALVSGLNKAFGAVKAALQAEIDTLEAEKRKRAAS